MALISRWQAQQVGGVRVCECLCVWGTGAGWVDSV